MSIVRRVNVMLCAILAIMSLTFIVPTGSEASAPCPTAHEQELTASYQMVFDRAPDTAGLSHWLENFDQYPTAHLNSAEPGTDSVAQWYENLYGRAPSDAAAAYWATVSKEEALRAIAASPEAKAQYREQTGCTDVVAPSTDIQQRIRETFPENPERMLRIAFCESSYNLGAVGPDGNDLGLFQVRWTVHHKMLTANGLSRSDLFTLEGNLKAARLVYDDAAGWHPKGGTGPWVCRG